MKATELRIGNYIDLEDKGIYQIDCGHDIDEIDSFPDKEEYSKGINITDEWLSKLGFEESICFSTWFIGNLVLDSENRLSIIDDKGYGIVIARDVKEVHRLQNIYFSLHGQELKRIDE